MRSIANLSDFGSLHYHKMHLSQVQQNIPCHSASYWHAKCSKDEFLLTEYSIQIE